MTDTTEIWPSIPSSSGATAQGSGQTGERVEGAKNLWVRTGYRRRRTKAKPLIIASWNVRTLLDRKRSNRPERRTALVTRELQRYNVDVAALSETRFLDIGQLTEVGSGYTIYWSGRKAGRKAGVGFAIKTSLSSNHNPEASMRELYETTPIWQQLCHLSQCLCSNHDKSRRG